MGGLRRLITPKTVGGSLVVLITLWSGFLLARNDGIIGVSTSATGCVCHNASPNASGNVTVTISGPQTVDISSTNSYTIMVSGGPAGTTGGFNLSADGGTLIEGANNQLDTGELTHKDRNSRSWTFDWQAPATEGTNNFFAVAQATNGSGTSNDSWNWYAGQAGAGFQIRVERPVQTIPSSWGRVKSVYR
jgi:hypothetical protein